MELVHPENLTLKKEIAKMIQVTIMHVCAYMHTSSLKKIVLKV